MCVVSNDGRVSSSRAGDGSLRKTYKYKLKPTPAQERQLEDILWRCRTLYNTALEHRIFLYRQRGVSLTRYAQEAELKDLRAALPEYAAIHSHVLQDVLARLDKTYQAFFRRLREGQTPASRAFRAATGSPVSPTKSSATGATVSDNGYLVLSKIGRVAVRWSRPLEGTPKTVTISREADGWYVCISCADVPDATVAAHGQRDRALIWGWNPLRHWPTAR